MYLDKTLISHDAISTAVGAGTVNGETIDLWGGAVTNVPGAAGGPDGVPQAQIAGNMDITQGGLVLPFALMNEAFASATGTIQLILEKSANSDMSSPTAIYTGSALGEGVAVAGYQFPIPPFKPTDLGAERYIRFKFVIATAAGTAGKITSGLKFDNPHAGNAY